MSDQQGPNAIWVNPDSPYPVLINDGTYYPPVPYGSVISAPTPDQAEMVLEQASQYPGSDLVARAVDQGRVSVPIRRTIVDPESGYVTSTKELEPLTLKQYLDQKPKATNPIKAEADALKIRTENMSLSEMAGDVVRDVFGIDLSTWDATGKTAIQREIENWSLPGAGLLKGYMGHVLTDLGVPRGIDLAKQNVLSYPRIAAIVLLSETTGKRPNLTDITPDGALRGLDAQRWEYWRKDQASAEYGFGKDPKTATQDWWSLKYDWNKPMDEVKSDMEQYWQKSFDNYDHEVDNLIIKDEILVTGGLAAVGYKSKGAALLAITNYFGQLASTRAIRKTIKSTSSDITNAIKDSDTGDSPILPDVKIPPKSGVKEVVDTTKVSKSQDPEISRLKDELDTLRDKLPLQTKALEDKILALESSGASQAQLIKALQDANLTLRDLANAAARGVASGIGTAVGHNIVDDKSKPANPVITIENRSSGGGSSSRPRQQALVRKQAIQLKKIKRRRKSKGMISGGIGVESDYPTLI